MLMPPLAPGEPLWPELREELEGRAGLEAAAAEAAARQLLAQEEASVASLSAGIARTGDGSAAATEEVGELQASTGDDISGAGRKGGQAGRNVVLLYGPPKAGVSTQAALLGRRYQLPVVTVDSLVAEAAQLKKPPPPPPPAPAAPTAEPSGDDPPQPEGAPAPAAEPPAAAAPAAAEPSAGSALRSPSAAAGTALAATRAASPGPAPGPGRVTGTPVPPEPPHDVEALVSELKQRLLERPASRAKPPQAEVQQLLQSVLALVLAQPRYAAGLIVDGLACRHLAPTAAATCLLHALGFSTLPQRVTPPPSATPPPTAGPAPAKGQAGKAAAPAAKKPAAAEPVPEAPQLPEVWLGPHKLHVVLLQADRDTAAARASGAAAARHGSQQELPEQQQQPSSTGTKPGSHRPQQELEVAWEAYTAEAPALSLLLAGQEGPTRLVHREVPTAGLEAAEVYRSVCGLASSMGHVVSLLPPAPEDELLVPEPYCMQVGRLLRPAGRRAAGVHAKCSCRQHRCVHSAAPVPPAAGGSPPWQTCPEGAAGQVQAAHQDRQPDPGPGRPGRGHACSVFPRLCSGRQGPRQGHRRQPAGHGQGSSCQGRSRGGGSGRPGGASSAAELRRSPGAEPVAHTCQGQRGPARAGEAVERSCLLLPPPPTKGPTLLALTGCSTNLPPSAR
jgi:hypothetical protein